MKETIKYLVILLFLFSCKGKTEGKLQVEAEEIVKTENGIDKTVYEMWNSFIDVNPQFKKEELPDSEFFHDNEKDAARLAKLIIDRKKQAGSGLYMWYKEANAHLPQIGTKLIVTDFNGKAQAIIETKKVDTIPFNQVTKEYATLDMGTDIEPLKKWREAHWDFFANAMKQNEQQPTEDMLVVCEWFETVWPKK